MNDEELDERERRQAQSFRNMVTVIVFAIIIGTLAALYYVALGGTSGQGIVGAVCTVGFLAIAFLGWEYLMKPGYGLHARMQRRQMEVEEAAPPKEPRSPGAP